MNAISHGQGSGRGAGALETLLDRASPTSLRWFAGLLGAFQGSVLLVVPHGMQSVAYETLQPHLAAWGLAFLVSGCLMLVVTSSRIGQRWVLVTHLPLALSFLALAAVLVLSGLWTAVATVGLLGLGVAAAAFLPPRGRRRPVPGDLFALLMAATGMVGGLLLAAGPVLLDHPIYRLSQPVLPILGVTWLVVGILLWRVQTSPVNQPAWLRSVHALAGVQMLLVGLVISLPSGAWFGVAYYLGGGSTLALLPWLRRRLSGFDALSLRTRLALTLALLASASLTLTVALMSHQQEQQARRHVQQTLEQRAKLMAATVSDYLSLKALLVENLATKAQVELDEPAIHTLADSCPSYDRDFAGCILVDAEGRVISRWGDLALGQGVVQDTLEVHRRDGSGYPQLRPLPTGQPLPGEARAQAPLLSAGLFDTEEQLLGALFAAVDPKRLTQRLQNAGATITITDRFGQVIAHQPLPVQQPSSWLTWDELEQPEPFDAALTGRAAMPLGPDPAAAWTVTVSQPPSYALAGVHRGRETAFLLLLVMVGLAVVLGLMAAASITRPLDSLLSAVEQLEAGNPEAPVVLGNLTEVDRLSAAFNRMRDRLAERTTEREQLARELKARAEMLADHDRRKDEFLAMLAHELRNPLGAVANAVFLLKEMPPEPDKDRRMVEAIDRQTRHLSRMVDDLLDVSRITRGKVALRKDVVDLVPLARQVAEDSEAQVEAKGHSLRVDLPERSLWAEVDPTRVGQILGNLVSNAVKYTDPGGEIELSGWQEDGQAVFAVRDNGRGLPPEMIPRVFEMFTQGDQGLDRSDSGLGIGLTLVRQLAEMHGGTVEAESPGLGQGSEFRVRLPLAAAPIEQEPVPQPVARLPSRRVLVVDDHVDAATALAEILQHSGHEVRVAHDGKKALEMAGEFEPGAVLIDIGLPGMDGYELARRLRADGFGDSILVAITGYGREEDRRRALDSGFDHHLTKPISPSMLRDLLSGSTAAERATG